MLNCEDIVILDAARTAFGSFRGTLKTTSAVTLGTTITKALLERNKIDPASVDELIMGQAVANGCGPNVARQVSIYSGLPVTMPSFVVNKLCGSGLKALTLAIQALRCGDAELIFAGGQESMSTGPHILLNSRDGVKLGDWTMKDSALYDGLIDIFNGYHMGVTAENVAKEFGVSREEQDAFAAESQRKTKAAMDAGYFDKEIIPVVIPQRKKDPIVFDKDEHPRPGTTVEVLAKLPPAFIKDGGTVTAGNASGMNDGASMVVFATAKKAKELGIEPMARVVAYASAGVDPKIMGTGPVPASKKCLEKANWSVDDLELIESNEAFASQAIYTNREMGWNTDIVNVNGGAISLGHPVAATGPRLVGTLIYEMQRRNLHKGLATMCIGGGMGIALAVER